MRPIADLFQRDHKKLVPFITAGYPKLSLTLDLALAAEMAGAHMLELGMPFSDPIADGPVIQKASQVALDNGVTIDWILESVAAIKGQSDLPVALMGYFNPILQMGPADFLNQAAAAGVAGLIIPDLPIEEGEDFYMAAKEAGISAILLVAPNTGTARIARMGNLGQDLLYAVSLLGVTGAADPSQIAQKSYLQRVRASTKVPFVVGFGIRTPNDVARVAVHADGVVVGSALLEVIAGSNNPVQAATRYLKSLVAALP